MWGCILSNLQWKAGWKRRHGPYRNPAVEWDRLAKAALDLGINKLDSGHAISGGSTLATQLEKMRHSPDGRTGSVTEKFRQMISASLSAYRNGVDTRAARKQIVCDYINSIPLGAVSGYGEVTGLEDGLRAWFGADVNRVNQLLLLPEERIRDARVRRERALAYRQVLTLLMALKKPSAFLGRDREALDARADGYLRLLDRAGIISTSLSDLALEARVTIRNRAAAPASPSYTEGKGTLAVRNGLPAELGVDSAYALDRLDLTVKTTLDGPLEREVTKELTNLNDPQYAEKAGVTGFQLLSPGNAGPLIYSFTLYERANGANLLRVEADNYGRPLNINEGTRLELGSTAKLRTLVTYLEIVTALHKQYASATPEELNAARAGAEDRITQWALDYLIGTPDHSLSAMYQAALDRKYSANPGETFFTGGGAHHFENFEREDNGRVLPVREAFRRSVNRYSCA